jgi:hypothetical protein
MSSSNFVTSTGTCVPSGLSPVGRPASAARFLNCDDTWSHLDSMLGFVILGNDNDRVEGLVNGKLWLVEVARKTRDSVAGPLLLA